MVFMEQAFASKDITEDSMYDLPAVQVGDPFQEKVITGGFRNYKTDAVVGMTWVQLELLVQLLK